MVYYEQEQEGDDTIQRTPTLKYKSDIRQRHFPNENWFLAEQQKVSLPLPKRK